MQGVVERTSDVESLSARQVRLLLRTVAAHKTHLDSAHQDATFLARAGLRPAYLLDFDLLYMYMFEYEEHVDWSQELQFLISQRDTLYVLGPGTQTELIRLSASSQSGRAGRVSAAEIARRLPELARVLQAPNVAAYEDLVGSMQVDDDSYEVAKATLDRSRRRTKEDANQADALNWAAVVYLRRHLEQLQLGGFPYLLTGTDPLLREEAWDADFGVPISRGPGAAIYSQVLLDTYSEPADAVRHTIQGAFQIATAERDLRTSPAYLDPDRYRDEPDWEATIAAGRVSTHLRDQVASLSRFVDDTVIYMTQRIYDNADLVAANVARQTHTPRTGRGHESPRRLFDLIASMNAALRTDSSRGLSTLWNTVLELTVEQLPAFTLYELRDRGGRSDRPAYFSLEVHPATDASSQPLYVMRWPCGIDADAILAAAHEAFARHDVTRFRLAVGTPADVQLFAAEFPLSLNEIVSSLSTETTEGRSDAKRAAVCWVRMDAEPFDIYADVAAEVPHDPVIGVFAPSLNSAHVVELYEKSSARYLFPAWLRGALDHIRGIAVGPNEAGAGRVGRSDPHFED